MRQYFVLLKDNHNYRFLWVGSVVTQLGDWFNLLASAELVTTLSHSGTAISYLFLARFLPLFVFSPIAGVLADRYNRRHIMVMTDVLRAGIVLCFLLIHSPEQIWLLYLLTVLQFTLSALFTPARSAVLANIVSRENLVTANALDSLTWSTMLALGALLGGIAAAILGANAAFIIDASTFLFSGWTISRIVDHSEVVENTTTVLSKGVLNGWLEFMAGFQYLLSVPFILGVSLTKGMGSLVWGAINVLEINFADAVFPLKGSFLQRALHIESGGTATLGIIYVISGLGTGLGPLLLRRLLGDAYHRMLWGIGLGFFLLAGGILGLSMAPNLMTFGIATLVRTVGSGVVWVFSAALLQMLVPDQFRGRVFAFEFAILTLTQSLSTFAAGLLQDKWEMGIQETTAVFAWLGVFVLVVWLAFLLVFLPRYLRLHKIEQEI